MIFHKKKSACLRAQTSSSTHANQFLQFQIFLQNCNHKITYNHKLFIHKINHNHTKESFKNQSQSYIHIYLKKNQASVSHAAARRGLARPPAPPSAVARRSTPARIGLAAVARARPSSPRRGLATPSRRPPGLAAPPARSGHAKRPPIGPGLASCRI